MFTHQGRLSFEVTSIPPAIIHFGRTYISHAMHFHVISCVVVFKTIKKKKKILKTTVILSIVVQLLPFFFFVIAES